MTPTPGSQAHPALGLATRLACLGAGAIALLALLGWQFELPLLSSWAPGRKAMNPMTAVCFLLASASLWIMRQTEPGARAQRFAQVCATLIAAIGLAKLLSVLTGVPLPLDQILFHDRLAASAQPNQISPHTALSFVLVGSGLLSLGFRTRRGRELAQPLLLAVTAIALMALLGYLYNAPNMYGIASLVPQAASSACAFLLISVGALLAQPDSGLCRLVLSPSPGGVMARRLLPVAVVMPIVLGWLRLWGQRAGLYELEIGTAMVMLTIVGMLVGMVWLTGQNLDAADGERRCAEAALRESGSRLQAILDNTTIVIYLKDLEGRLLLANRSFEELTGKKRSEIVGHMDSEVLAGDTLATFRANDKDVVAADGPMTFERTVVLGGGTRTFVSVKCALRDEAGRPYAICGVATEITDRKRAEEQAQRFRSFLDSIVENLPNMLFVKNAADLRFVRLNRAAEELLGYTRNELLGKNDYDFFAKEQADFFTSKDRQVLASGAQVEIAEEVVTTRTKGQRLLRTKKVPIMDEEGQPLFLLGISEDITERRQAEKEIEALHQSVKSHAAQLELANRELEAFSYSVSHDLRAPLRHIAGFVDMLLKQNASQLDETGKRRLTAVSGSAHKMGQLIDDLLVFSRMGRTEMQRSKVSLPSLVQAIIAELEADTKGRHIRWVIGALPQVEGDPAMLRLVLTNLVANAVKYSGTREEAVIEIGAEEHADEGTVVFVRDNGVGFDMEYSGKLFGVFQRLHKQEEFPGTGIGLASVRRIIQRHGGKTWAEAALDRGATFYFSLPTHEDKEERWAA